jgi:phage terminase large subunit
MAGRLILAPPEKLRQLAELRARLKEQEAEKSRNTDAFAVLGFEPTCMPRHAARTRGDLVLPDPCGTCPQEQFFAACEDFVLYGGSAGGGKTCAIVLYAIRACVRHPGIRVLILRRTFDELAESIYPEFAQVGWAAALGARFNKTEKELTFPNGSLIRLRYLDSADDASRRQGGAYQLLLVDELTLMPPGAVDTIAMERLRNAHGIPVLGLRGASNPGGPSHGEVLSRYIEATDYGTKVVTDDNGLTTRFIPARATDNPHLDEAYHRRLDAIPDPVRRSAMRDGNWDHPSGQMFRQVNWDRHTIEPFDVPASWRRYMSVDWGFTKPWGVLWGAVSEDGRCYVTREIYQAQVGEEDQARRILAAEEDGEQIVMRLADDAMFATRGSAMTIADIYAENGVYLTPAGKGAGSRVTGWQRIHTYLAEGPACFYHRSLGWATCPMIHFFRSCPKMWWELKNLPYATKGNTEDANSEAPDHLCDALRYWLVNLGSGPQFPVIGDDPKETPGDHLGEYVPMGPAMVVVPRDGQYIEPEFWTGDDGDKPKRGVQRSPFL